MREPTGLLKYPDGLKPALNTMCLPSKVCPGRDTRRNRPRLSMSWRFSFQRKDAKTPSRKGLRARPPGTDHASDELHASYPFSARPVPRTPQSLAQLGSQIAEDGLPAHGCPCVRPQTNPADPFRSEAFLVRNEAFQACRTTPWFHCAINCRKDTVATISSPRMSTAA